MAEEGMNKVLLLGRLGADPELRMTSGGQAVLKLRLATTENYLDKNRVKQERTEWHSCVLWGARAEALSKILSKGSKILVEGGLRTSSYDDSAGQKRYKTEVNVNNVILCGGGQGGGAQRESGDRGSKQPSGGSYDDADYGGGGDDDIPFLTCSFSASEPWWRF